MAMAMRQGLELKQTQRLTMTPELRQSIGMLRMSLPELEAHLLEETEKNPLLDVERPADAGRAAPEADRRGRIGPTPSAGDAAEALAAVSAPVSLAEHVRGQLGCAALPPATRALADMLCGDLDEDGYLRIDRAEAAARFGADAGTLSAAIRAIRDCDPTGVGASDLADCLGLQLAERGELDADMAALLGHLDQLPERAPNDIAALCGVAPTALGRKLAQLRRLDPRPGARFALSAPEPAAPDLLVEREGACGWRVALNEAAFPRLAVDDAYATRLAGGTTGAARAYLEDCARAAQALQRSLRSRARTVLAVATAVVERQTGFLDAGVRALKPMTLGDVAAALDMHESTVSRAVAGKTMATPRGVVALRAFFSAALSCGTEDGEAAAAQAVRARIRALVEAEPPGRPLSDDALVKALGAEGVRVARRTVAKYREALGIPSSFARKRRAVAATSLY
jgi:RNA polymerase sigma-54 factor